MNRKLCHINHKEEIVSFCFLPVLHQFLQDVKKIGPSYRAVNCMCTYGFDYLEDEKMMKKASKMFKNVRFFLQQTSKPVEVKNVSLCSLLKPL